MRQAKISICFIASLIKLCWKLTAKARPAKILFILIEPIDEDGSCTLSSCTRIGAFVKGIQLNIVIKTSLLCGLRFIILMLLQR